jgi:CheY-like chemotaxis protein
MENNHTKENNANGLIVLEVPEQKDPVKHILFVDDEEPVRELFKEALEKFGFRVSLANNGNEGLESFRNNPADLIITDIFMPEKDGHAFILEVLQEFPDAKIFAITGKKSFEPEMELDIAKTLGALRVFSKPCKLSELIAAIREL